MNEVRQCQIEESVYYCGVAVKRELDDGEVMWYIAHPVTGGRWATPEEIADIEESWGRMVPETTLS